MIESIDKPKHLHTHVHLCTCSYMFAVLFCLYLLFIILHSNSPQIEKQTADKKFEEEIKQEQEEKKKELEEKKERQKAFKEKANFFKQAASQRQRFNTCDKHRQC